MPPKIVFYNQCGCITTSEDVLPIVKDFLTGMGSGGTYYNPNEQTAINNLVEDILTQTGARQIVIVATFADLPTPGDPNALYLVIDTKHSFYWNGATYQYIITQEDFTTAYKAKLDVTVLSVNNLLPDLAGNVAITPSDVNADPAGTAQTLMDAHLANPDPHSQYALDAEKAQPSGIATLDSSGKLLGSQIPDIAITDFLGSVLDQATMLTLVGQKGDWAARQDTGTNWIITGNDPTKLTSWMQLSYPAAPVLSVNGKVGAVTLDYSDVGAIANQNANQQAAGFNITGVAWAGQLNSYGRVYATGEGSYVAVDAIGYSRLGIYKVPSDNPKIAAGSATPISFGHISNGNLESGGTYTERMAISTAGNLLIGSTTDNGTDKLQVNGNISGGHIDLSGRVFSGGANSAFVNIGHGFFDSNSIGLYCSNPTNGEGTLVNYSGIYIRQRDNLNSWISKIGISGSTDFANFEANGNLGLNAFLVLSNGLSNYDGSEFLVTNAGVMKLRSLASAPTILKGGLYYNTTTNKGQIGISGAWQNIATENNVILNQNTSAESKSFWVNGASRIENTLTLNPPLSTGAIGLNMQQSLDNIGSNTVSFIKLAQLNPAGGSPSFGSYLLDLAGGGEGYSYKFLVGAAGGVAIGNVTGVDRCAHQTVIIKNPGEANAFFDGYGTTNYSLNLTNNSIGFAGSQGHTRVGGYFETTGTFNSGNHTNQSIAVWAKSSGAVAANYAFYSDAGVSYFADGVQTGQPSGNGNAIWKLGKVISATATLDSTKYIEVMISGSLYKILIST
jgi:hypothetical protein